MHCFVRQKTESSIRYTITIAGAIYNSIWAIRKELDDYEKDTQGVRYEA